MLTMLTVDGAGGTAAAASGPDPRLKPAAHEFEAALMKEFLEPLQHDSLFDDDAGGAASPNALMGFAAETLAQAISERGGFGIANKILTHFGTGAPSRSAGRGADESFLRMGGKP